VEIVVLVTALTIGFVIALALSRFVLGTILDAMAGRRPLAAFGVQWRRVAFVGSLFWLWYLVPGLAAAAHRSTAAVIFRHLLGK
jgi:hypothetical protein